MALIKCPECGKEISDQSRECVACGYPISPISEQSVSKAATNQSTNQIKEKNQVAGCVGSVVIILIIAIIIYFVGSAIFSNINNNQSNRTSVTLSEYNQVRTGMSYREVVEIFGSNGELVMEISDAGGSAKTYSWDGSKRFSKVFIVFDGNKVFSKTQAGLE